MTPGRLRVPCHGPTLDLCLERLRSNKDGDSQTKTHNVNLQHEGRGPRFLIGIFGSSGTERGSRVLFPSFVPELS